MSNPSPHGFAFDSLVDCLIEGLRDNGVRIRDNEITFGCEYSLGARGPALPPGDVLLDRAAAARHFADLLDVRCPVIEIRSGGWLPGHRYLVLLAHARYGGSAHPCPMVWAHTCAAIGPISAAWFQRLEHRPLLRPLLYRLSGRWGRSTVDFPYRGWPDHTPLDDWGCPTVLLPGAV